MSLNVSGSKYVRVYNPTIKLDVSDKMLFADLRTSRKTGNTIEKGEGKEVQERAFSNWKARFVGNAFEPAKGLRAGDSIDIVSGWITNEPYKGKDEKTYYNTYVNIAEFTLSEVVEGEDADEKESENV